MTNETLWLIVLAIGTGISIGWLLKAQHGKLSPEGVQKLAMSQAAIHDRIREDAKEQIATIERRCEAYEAVAHRDAEFWRAHALELAKRLKMPLEATPLRPPTPPPPIANGKAMAPTEGLSDAQKKVASALVAQGATPEAAAAAARGDDYAIDQDPVLSDIASGVAASETGVT